MKYITLLTALFVTSTILVSNNAYADYLPSEESAAAQVDTYERVVDFLKSEQFTPSRLDLRRLSGDPVADLVKVANGRLSTALRGRAVQSLALYNNDLRALETIDGLKASLRDSDKLLPSIIVAWAQIHGEEAAQELVTLAQHQRSDIRIAAIIGLGRFGGQLGYDSLTKLASVEKNASIRARIESYIR